MHFYCNDTALNLFRHSYHFHDPEQDDTILVSGDWILELYYNFDGPPDIGWGTVGGEFVHWKDIGDWLQGMEKVEEGKAERFEQYFYQDNAEKYFLKLTLEAVDDKLRLQLSISDSVTDNYIDIDQLFSKEEWKTYSDEFRTWNEIFPYQLGDHVRTVRDLRNGVKANKDGIVFEIDVSDGLNDDHDVSYGVASVEKGWDGPYWDGFYCDPDEIELIEKNKHRYQ